MGESSQRSVCQQNDFYNDILIYFGESQLKSRLLLPAKVFTLLPIEYDLIKIKMKIYSKNFLNDQSNVKTLKEEK